MLEHVDFPAKILQKYKRFVREGGYIFVSVPNGEGLHRRVGHIAGLLDDMFKLSEHDIRLGHKRYYNTKTLKEEFEAAYIRNPAIEGIFLKPITTAQIKQLGFSKEILNAFCVVGKDYPDLCNGLLAYAQL